MEEYPDGIAIDGPQTILGKVNAHHDHRIIMTAAIAGLIALDDVTIDSIAAVATSFPSFWESLGVVGC